MMRAPKTMVKMASKKSNLILAALLACSVASPALAAPIPFPAREVNLTARGQKLNEVLKDLFGQAGLNVRISSAVTGNVQGKFVGPPSQIWNQFSKAYQLVAYFDGSAVQIYSANEIRSRTIEAQAPASVVSEARRLGLVDGSNTVTAGTNSVSANGVPAFIDRINAIAGTMKPRAAPVVAGRPTTPPPPIPASKTTSTADIISPVAGKPNPGAPMAGGQPRVAATAGVSSNLPTNFVRSIVRTQATARTPYEIRVFYLKYAKAQDTRGENGEVISGVASQLIGLMGNGRSSTTVGISGNSERVRKAIDNGVIPGRVGMDGEIYDPRENGREDFRAPAQESNDVNGPRIEIDAANNAVIVRDRPESMPTYESLVAAADLEPTNIELEATIITLNTTRAKRLGLDFSFSTGGISAIFGSPVEQGGPGSISGSYLIGPASFFNMRLTALEKTGTVKVVAKPRVVTQNHLRAMLSEEEERYIKIESERVADVRVVKAGLNLSVKPQIAPDLGEIRTNLEIYIQDGQLARDPDGVPMVKRTQLRTSALVKQGDAIILGGMSISSEFDTKQKTPIAGDIPVVGNAFKKRDKETSRYERLFIITPRVMTQGSAAAAPTRNVPALINLEQVGKKPKKKGN